MNKLNSGTKSYLSKLFMKGDITNPTRHELSKRWDVHINEIHRYIAELGAEGGINDFQREAFKVGEYTVAENGKAKYASVEEVKRESLIKQLEKKVAQTTEKARYLESIHKTAIKNESLVEVLSEALQDYCTPMVPLPPQSQKFNKADIDVEEDLVILLSDEHADQVVLPHRVNGLENYNMSVAFKRGETLVSNIIKFTTQTLINYKFKTVWILCLGDHVNGAIHEGTESSVLKNDFANSVAVGQLHALMFRDLAPYFEEIKVLYVVGNHGRQSPKKDFHNPLRNLDYVVAETSRAHCRDIKNIEIEAFDSHSVNVDINGFIFNLSHGDDIVGSQGIPYYGIERKNRRLSTVHAQNGKQIQYKVMGHFHVASSLQDPVGETFINGSWKATDEYLYNSFGGYSEPKQWIFGVHAKRGITWRLQVNLRSENEQEGPSRYKLDMACRNFTLEGVNK